MLTQRALFGKSVSKLRVALFTATAIPLVSLMAWAFWVQAVRVPYGTFIADVNLGALDWREARAKLVEFAKNRDGRKITWTVGERHCIASPTQMGASIDVAATFRRLEALSRKRGTVSRLVGAPAPVLPEIALNREKVDAWRETCESTVLDDRPVVGRLVAKPNGKDVSWVIEEPKAGRRIAVARISDALRSAVTRLDDASIALPVETVDAYPEKDALLQAKEHARELLRKPVTLLVEGGEKRITLLRSELAKMLTWYPTSAESLTFEVSRPAFEQWLSSRRHRVEQPARNATYELDRQNKLVLVPEATGNKIALNALYDRVSSVLKAGQHEVIIPFEPTSIPRLRTGDIEGLNIHELVGSFTTRHACCQPRVKNIHRIADLLNGVIVLPGATFSVNETVGPRTLENGFVAAPSIQDGDMMDTIGGGISQFATTFYNAAMRGGYEILERQAHSYWFERYPMGHEATLSWPKPDVVIRNDTQSGLLILTSYDERSITVKLYGDKEGRTVTFGSSPRFDIVLPKTELLPNPELEPDKEEIKEGGCIGWSVTTTRTVILKDHTRREDKRKVVYKPRIRRVEVHPCKIPAGEPGATGEKCPKVKPEETSDAEGVDAGGLVTGAP